MGAILYAGIEKLVYAATLEDSARHVDELLIPCKSIAQICKNRQIKIVAELERDKAIAVFETWAHNQPK